MGDLSRMMVWCCSGDFQVAGFWERKVAIAGRRQGLLIDGEASECANHANLRRCTKGPWESGWVGSLCTLGSLDFGSRAKTRGVLDLASSSQGPKGLCVPESRNPKSAQPSLAWSSKPHLSIGPRLSSARRSALPHYQPYASLNRPQRGLSTLFSSCPIEKRRPCDLSPVLLSTMTEVAIRHAYRNLYRQSLRAVHYSKPARYLIRDTLRKSFRTEPLENFRPLRIARTLQFLQTAEREAGIEHQILKNILSTRKWQVRPRESRL